MLFLCIYKEQTNVRQISYKRNIMPAKDLKAALRRIWINTEKNENVLFLLVSWERVINSVTTLYIFTFHLK